MSPYRPLRPFATNISLLVALVLITDIYSVIITDVYTVTITDVAELTPLTLA